MWSEPQPRRGWLGLTDLLLVIEIVSPGSEAMDELLKRHEYARADIPRYWPARRGSRVPSHG
jgi:Uma2 family endonuclease